MATWIVTYEDGDEIREEVVTGKLSLDQTWAFVIDANRPVSTITLAVPAHRIIDIKEEVD